MKTLLLLFVALFLQGCEQLENKDARPDQCLRAEIFKQCMAALPKGPERIGTSNDWSEVVDSCEAAARKQSVRPFDQIKPACRWY